MGTLEVCDDVGQIMTLAPKVRQAVHQYRRKTGSLPNLFPIRTVASVLVARAFSSPVWGLSCGQLTRFDDCFLGPYLYRPLWSPGFYRSTSWRSPYVRGLDGVVFYPLFVGDGSMVQSSTLGTEVTCGGHPPRRFTRTGQF